MGSPTTEEWTRWLVEFVELQSRSTDPKEPRKKIAVKDLPSFFGAMEIRHGERVTNVPSADLPSVSECAK